MRPTPDLSPAELQRFWQIPDHLFDWGWPAQEVLLKQMHAHADKYFEMVENGDATGEGDVPLSDSGMFPFEDRFTLFALVRMLKPARIVEIGSGDSTKVVNLALRATRAEDPAYRCQHQCIEPYRTAAIDGITVDPPEIISKRLEEVDVALFDKLQQVCDP